MYISRCQRQLRGEAIVIQSPTRGQTPHIEECDHGPMADSPLDQHGVCIQPSAEGETGNGV